MYSTGLVDFYAIQTLFRLRGRFDSSVLYSQFVVIVLNILYKFIKINRHVMTSQISVEKFFSSFCQTNVDFKYFYRKMRGRGVM